MKGSGLKYFKLQMVLELSRNYLELVSVKSCVKMGKHLQSPRTKSHQEIATDAVNSLLEVKEVNFKPKSIKNKHYKQKYNYILLEAFYDLIDFLGLIDVLIDELIDKLILWAEYEY